MEKHDMTTTGVAITMILILLISAGCRPEPPVYAKGGAGWYTGKKRLYLQDATGQVFFADQADTNSNLYVLWQSATDTNGVTNSMSYQLDQMNQPASGL